MEYADISDLEEGEILDCEFCFSDDNSDNVEQTSGFENNPSHLIKKEMPNKLINSCHINKKGCTEKNLKDSISKYCSRGKREKIKYESELVSLSVDEVKSHKDKCLFPMFKNSGIHSEEDMKKSYFSQMTYGTVEHLMSEIGETISRNSWCNYKKPRTRESNCNYDLIYHYKSSSCGIRPRKTYSSLFSSIKGKHQKRKRMGCQSHAVESEINSEEELPKHTQSRVRKKKKKDGYRSEKFRFKKVESSRVTKDPEKKLRDFDEVRKSLLEKLEKQKAEEKSKMALNNFEQRNEISESKEIQMVLDHKTYAVTTAQVDVESKKNMRMAGRKTTEGNYFGNEKDDGGENCHVDDDDDETDLIKLRLMALASNRKRENPEKANENFLEMEKFSDANSESENMSKEEENNGSCGGKEFDLDRHELLLRAEALKTALLKKHKKIRSKLKKEKRSGCDDEREKSSEVSVGNNVVSGSLTRDEEDVDLFTNSRLDVDAFKENLNEEGGSGLVTTVPKVSSNVLAGRSVETKHENAALCTNLKKMNLKGRSKKRKKMSNSSESEVKENSGKDVVEEDDRTLRSRLLCDLLKKKSLKVVGKKSVLMDSEQTSACLRSVAGGETSKVRQRPAELSLKNRRAIKAKGDEVIANGPSKVPKAEIQRIIVHLGSEDSSDEDAAPSNVPFPQTKDGKDAYATLSDAAVVNQSLVKSVKANYEKSVELLLSQARKKVEGEFQKKDGNDLTTPEAVYKHLPPSQRMEYIRLKRKIAERERLRNLRKQNSGAPTTLTGDVGSGTKRVNSDDAEKSPPPPPSSSSSENPKKGRPACEEPAARGTSVPTSKVLGKVSPRGLARTNENPSEPRNLRKSLPTQGRLRRSFGTSALRTCSGDRRLPLADGRTNISSTARKCAVLSPSLMPLLSKLKLMLKKVKIEKAIEDNYEKQIAKLKNEVSVLEKKKSEQRSKIRKLAEDSMKIYRAMQALEGPARKAVPGEKPEPERDAAPPPRHESETPIIVSRTGNGTSDINENDAIVNLEASATANANANANANAAPATEFLPYDSPLQVFKKPSNPSDSLDPNAIMCQFDLMGVCKDDECAYQHLRSS